jgi:hypothetical protein
MRFQRLLTGDTICPHQVATTTARPETIPEFIPHVHGARASGVDRAGQGLGALFPELGWSRAHGTGSASRPGRSIYLAGDAQRTDFSVSGQALAAPGDVTPGAVPLLFLP